MRHILLFLILSLLLTGCSASAPEPAAEPTLPAIPQTVNPTTIPTEPPDPMQMLLSSMTPEEKVGQLFLARCPSDNSLQDISDYHLGGYILFGQDFDNETPDTFRQKIADYQAAAPIPLLKQVKN